MKNNKYQITNIKGRLLHPGFVACCLLIVLLSACDDGYHAGVREIWFSQDGPSDKPRNEIIDVSINTTTETKLFVNCDTPSSIKEISLIFTYDQQKLNIAGIPYEENEDKKDSPDGKTTSITIKIDVNDLKSMEIRVKARNAMTATDIVEFTVTSEPGGQKAVCKFKT